MNRLACVKCCQHETKRLVFNLETVVIPFKGIQFSLSLPFTLFLQTILEDGGKVKTLGFDHVR